MNDAEETVQRLLRCLRDAEPAGNMNQRILNRIQHATEAREAAHAGRPWVLWPGRPQQALAMLIAAAALLAVGLVLVVTGRSHRPMLTNGRSPATRADTRQTATSLEGAQKPYAHSRHVNPIVPMTRARSHHAFAEGVRASNSYPAPPLPLTEQERLLLRLAHRRDTGNLTILNPDVRGAQAARTTEEFQRFFGMNDQEMRTQLE
jgi:hypothetical protein